MIIRSVHNFDQILHFGYTILSHSLSAASHPPLRRLGPRGTLPGQPKSGEARVLASRGELGLRPRPTYLEDVLYCVEDDNSYCRRLAAVPRF